MSFASLYQVLVAWRILSGVGAAMIFPVSMAYVGDIAPKGREGTFTGLFNLAFFTGFGIGPLLGGLLKEAFSMDMAFYAMGALTALSMVLVLLLLPQSQHRRHTRLQHPDASNIRRILTSNTVRAVLAFNLTWSMVSFATLAFIGIHLQDNLGVSSLLIGATISARQMVGGILQAPGGRLADSFNRGSLVTGAMTIAALDISGIGAANGFALAALLYAGIGLMESIAYPAVTAIAVEEGREHGMGGIMGLTNMVSSLGLIIGSLLGGLTADMLGIRRMFLMFGTTAAIGMLTFNYFMYRSRRYAAASLSTAIRDVGQGQS